jgi:hypothetical protein
MAKPYGRKVKKRVGQILAGKNRQTALDELSRIPGEQLVGPMFSHFYHGDELIKFRSTVAMGFLTAKIAEEKMEKARIILRRIMWNLNDESGGIGWGSPEAMGEILCHNDELALEFKSILFSYLDPDGNFLEHEMLQRGILWGVGTFLESNPDDLTDKTRDLLISHLHSDDPTKRGYAIRALINASSFDFRLVPENIVSDSQVIDIFNGWNFISTRISDIALACRTPREFA